MQITAEHEEPQQLTLRTQWFVAVSIVDISYSATKIALSKTTRISFQMDLAVVCTPL